MYKNNLVCLKIIALSLENHRMELSIIRTIVSEKEEKKTDSYPAYKSKIFINTYTTITLQ